MVDGASVEAGRGDEAGGLAGSRSDLDGVSR